MACTVLSRPRAEALEHRCFTDDDNVDRLTVSCQPKVRPPLSSSGRTLVPYFAPEAEGFPSQSLSEMATQHRKRKGPSAKAAHNKSNNSSKRVQNANVVPQKCKGKTVLSIKTQDQPTSAVAVRAKMASSKSAPIISGSVLPSHSGPVNKAAVTKAWAGPSFYKSPAPECLPLPTSYLLAV